MRPQICLLVPLGEGPVDPGYGRPGGGWSPVDPGYGVGSGLHPSTGPIYGGGHPDQGLPGAPGHPSTGPIYGGGRPDNSLPVPPPEGSPPVEIWPPRPTTWPPMTDAGVEISNPIVLPPPPAGTVVLVWISGVGYRYATIGAAQPK